jgi:3'-phosphoadenosine 5'-phosphosulfate sulfotransferase (PAPS reductase)/FAD synthetase
LKQTIHIINVSGGKDSTAVYLLALERGVPFRAVFADTGNEHEATYEFVRRLHERTGGPEVEWIRADFSTEIAQRREYILREWPLKGVPEADVQRAAAAMVPTGNPFLDLCIWKGRFPSTMARFCTQELKVIPVLEQIILPLEPTKNRVIQWLGVRADESPDRAKAPWWNRDDTGAMLWRPILRWTAADVFAFHRKHGLDPNPLYREGMGRVGCMPCINCRKGELKNIADRFPSEIERIREWEGIVARASKRSAATFFAPIVDGVPNQVDEVVEWSRTSRGGRQFQLGLDMATGCRSEYGLCE